MMLSIVIAVAIIIAASFGLHVQPITTLHPNLDSAQLANALFVCPAANPAFDEIGRVLRFGMNNIMMLFFGVLMLLIFAWGWGLYQNLLKDKFAADAYKAAWWWTKVVFWTAAIVVVLAWTPNNYRKVSVIGISGEYVLCEENTPGSIAVYHGKVKR